MSRPGDYVPASNQAYPAPEEVQVQPTDGTIIVRMFHDPEGVALFKQFIEGTLESQYVPGRTAQTFVVSFDGDRIGANAPWPVNPS